MEGPAVKRTVWDLAVLIGLAAHYQAAGAQEDVVAEYFENALALASLYSTQVPALPRRTGSKEEDGQAIFEYLSAEVPRKVMPELGSNIRQLMPERSPRAHQNLGTLFELGIKSNLCALIYEPSLEVVDSFASAFEGMSEALGFPPSLLGGLLEALQNRAPRREVLETIHGMQDRVQEYLEAVESWWEDGGELATQT